MRKFKKVIAAGLTAIMTVSAVSLSCLPARAGGIPTTDGHNKYVDSDVFKVISSDTFGTKELDNPLFDKTKGSNDISNLQVPTLAYDDTSIAIVWDKPERYDNVADYNVYINGKLAGTARQNYAENAKWADTYMKAFYEYYKTKSDVDMVDVDIHSYRATNLTPDTEYSFKVVAIDKDGKELGTPKEITQKTTVTPKEFNILDYGAKSSKGYTEYNDEVNALVEKNTKAIQAAIDACTPGGKVVIPQAENGEVFMSGALWLKSNITVELNGTLWASPNSDHFEIGFLMYPFYTDTRGWGLLNAMSADDGAPLENIRITGNGKLYGNGWKYGKADAMYEDGYTSNVGKNTMAGDPADTENWGLPRYMGGSNTKVYYYGIQAADSAKKYLANLTNEDGSRKYPDEVVNALAGYIKADLDDNGKINYNGKDAIYTDSSKKTKVVEKADLTNAYATRSSLLIMKNVTNVYVGDITVENPANHSVNILDSRNIATENVKVFSYDGNNGDGLGFGCSQNVICWNNFTDTGDDNLGFGASVGEGARDCDIQTNSEIWMFNNFLREGHGGLAAGSHTGNGIQDVLFEDTVMNHIDMAFRFKSAPTNGGFIANITMRDCAIADTQQAWVLTTSYSDPNSASTTEFAEIGKFYNFASYNISVYGVQYNTIQVLADVDPVANPQKPWHTHNHLYFQDVTFGNVGTNGSFKNKNGWESLIGCENAVFYNFKTVSYADKAKSKKTTKAWNNLQYCKDIVFQGTTWDSVGNPTDKMKNIMSGITVTDNKVTAEIIPATAATDGRSVKLKYTAVENGTEEVFYGVDTYVGDEKVDIVDGISTTEATIGRLSSGVTYTFKVYVSEKGDKANSMNLTGQNKTYLGEAKVTVDGEKDKTIPAPETAEVTLASPVYTHAQGTWTSISASDARIRGYKIYANGNLVNTVYNYQIPKFATATTVSKQIGSLTPGIDNKIQIVAFTDAGAEYKYPEASVTTLGNYDYQAPVFAESAKLTAEKKGEDVVLTWDAATDDTAVGGYRVYVDGTPIVPEGKEFNPVNGDYTTADTTYTVSGLDFTKEHTFTVQAGDTWWKAAQTMGTYDKMAGFNWTVKGLSTVLGADYTADSEVTDSEGNKVEVNVEADAGVVPNDVILKVDAVDAGNVFETVKAALENKKFTLLDIRLVDSNDVVVQPNGSIMVSVKVPEGYDSAKTKVYYVADDGSMTDMNAVYADGFMKFTVDHFSNYVIVDETIVTDNTGDTGNKGDDVVATGDSSVIWIYAMLMVLAIAAGGTCAVMTGKKRLYK